MELDRELETYRRELPRLLAEGHEGKFALVHGDRVDSLWDTDQQAYEEGCKRFKLELFLVQQVVKDEPPIYSIVDVIP
jgi:hypothetical protein